MKPGSVTIKLYEQQIQKLLAELKDLENQPHTTEAVFKKRILNEQIWSYRLKIQGGHNDEV